jgi:hypothetical protein
VVIYRKALREFYDACESRVLPPESPKWPEIALQLGKIYEKIL